MAHLLLIAFIAEHNLAISIVEHLTELLKIMFPDSRIASGLQMRRTKCTDLAKKLSNVISMNLAYKLQTNPFSIIIDETTDNSKMKCLSVLVKFFDNVDGYIKTKILELVNVYDQANEMVGSTGEAIFTMILSTLNHYNIPHDNLVGFAADTTSNMFGDHNSVVSRLRAHFPSMTIIKCICHSIHLCASEAAKTLPRVTEDLIRNIYSFFSHSAKRQFEFKLFSEFFENEPHVMLHPTQTRWLSLHNAVERLLKNWDALQEFFKRIQPIERLMSVDNIVTGMNDKSIFLYLNFLNFILPTLTHFNLLFQRKSPTIFLVHRKIRTLYQTTLANFCRKEAISNTYLGNFNPSDPNNWKPVNQVYVGAEIHKLTQKEVYRTNQTMITNVKLRCRGFYVKLCEEIKKRFDMSDPLLYWISFFEPKTLLRRDTRDHLQTLSDLVDLIPRIYKGNIQILDNEWRALDQNPIEIDPETCEVVPFYQQLGLIKYDGEFLFKNLSAFALQILSLPVSNADAERLFSKLNLVKTNIRNNLSVDTLRALLIIAEAVDEDEACFTFMPSEAMLNC